MHYTPRYRTAHELLTAAGFNPSGPGVRGYEITRTQLQNLGHKWHHIKGLDRVHALVAHGYINVHEDTSKKTLSGKLIHKSSGGYMAKQFMWRIQDADVPKSKMEKAYKDTLEWVENRRMKYRVLGFRGLIGQI